MDILPLEVVSHVFRFLSISDRKQAALVCKKWYNAWMDPYLQKDIIIKCRLMSHNSLPPSTLIQRKMTHLALGGWETSMISEENLVSLLAMCPSLQHLDLTHCNSLFFSGRLLENELLRDSLRKTLATVKELKLGCLKHITDVTFLRLVSLMENIERISLASTNMIMGNGFRKVNGINPTVFHFTTVLGFVKERAKMLKQIDLSYTTINNDAIVTLAETDGLVLKEAILKGCLEISDQGLKDFVSHQPDLEILDISGCKELGCGKTFFSTLAKHLPKLHTLLARKCVKLGQCDIISLADMNSLKCLDLGEVLNLFDQDLIKGMCGPGKGLHGLYLPFCPDLSDMFIFQLSAHNQDLTHLDLSSCLKLTDASLHAITRNLTSLRTLRLAYCRGISDLGMLGHEGESTYHIFDHDHIGCPCTRERESTIFRKPKGIIQQHKHSVSLAHIKVENGEDMFMLSNLKSLQTLDLSNCPRITDLGVTKAIKFRELRSISLNNLVQLTDKSIAAIARNNHSLEELNVRCNANITDAAVADLVSSCPRLTTLDLSQCDRLTSKSLESLSLRSKHLRNLDVSFCGGLTIEAVNLLESQLPNVNVAFRPYLY